MERDDAGRPLAAEPLAAALEALAEASAGALGQVDPRHVLVVAGAARREARASIRPLTFGGAPPERARGPWEKPLILRRGAPQLYELCLRPRFFLGATPLERLTVLAHELWHASPAFDGALAEDRRHRAAAPGSIEREVAALVEPWRSGARALPPILSHRGELRVPAWLSRPPTQQPRGAGHRARYDDRDLFLAIVEQR